MKTVADEAGKLSPCPEELPPYKGCFVCDKDNACGLQLQFYLDGDRAYAEFVPSGRFQGYTGMLHGGIISTLLDEVMVKAISGQGVDVVTAKMETRFRRPVPLGRKLFVEGRIVSARKKLYEARGEIRDESGRVLAEASGLFMRPACES